MRRLSPSTCRQRASQLRRFAEWLDGPGAGAASLADAVDTYAESRFEAGASVATVAGDLGAMRWYAGAAGIEDAASLGALRRSWAGFRAASIEACEHSPPQHVASRPQRRPPDWTGRSPDIRPGSGWPSI